MGSVAQLLPCRPGGREPPGPAGDARSYFPVANSGRLVGWRLAGWLVMLVKSLHKPMPSHLLVTKDFVFHPGTESVQVRTRSGEAVYFCFIHVFVYPQLHLCKLLDDILLQCLGITNKAFDILQKIGRKFLLINSLNYSGHDIIPPRLSRVQAMADMKKKYTSLHSLSVGLDESRVTHLSIHVAHWTVES